MKRILAISAFVSCLSMAQVGDSLAMVTDLTGVATLEKGKALALTQELGPLHWVILEKGATLTLVHMKSGEEMVFKGPGRFRITEKGAEGLAPAGQKQVKAVSGAVKLQGGAMARASVVMREAVDGRLEARAASLQSPQGPRLFEACPEFKWQNAGPKASYVLKLQDEVGQLLFEVTLDEPSLKVPPHLAFKPGATYYWSLNIQAPQSPEQVIKGHFKTLDEAERQSVQQAKSDADTFSKRVILASLLEQLEANGEALELWRALAKERPEDALLQKRAGR